MTPFRFIFCFGFIAPTLFGFNLQRYPLVSEMEIGTVTVEVQPARQLRIKAPATGLLHLHLPPNGVRVSKGTIWAELDPARLDLERRAMKLARDLLAEKEEPALRLEHARTRAELADRLDELQRQILMLKQLQEQPDLASLYLNKSSTDNSPADSSAKIDTALTQLSRQAELLDRVLDYVGTPRQDELEITALRLKLEQQQLELDRRTRDSRLIMPFDGEITLIPPPPVEGEALYIENGMDLARLEDFSRVTARAVIRQTNWRLIPPLDLSLQLSTHSGGLRARFSRGLVEEVFGRDELVYYFSFAPRQIPAVRPLVGGQISGQIIAQLSEPAYLIPKLSLVLADPEIFTHREWSEAVPMLIPGARVILQGETHLAIVVQP